MTIKKFNHCSECRRLLKDDETVCPHCGTVAKRRPDPVREALVLLMSRVNEIKGYWTESLDNAMFYAELALRPTARIRCVGRSEPKAVGLSDKNACTQLLELARDSMDAADVELQAANKLANGMASLLLLDMIRETSVMAARIRAILNATREGVPVAPLGVSPEFERGPGDKGTEAP